MRMLQGKIKYKSGKKVMLRSFSLDAAVILPDLEIDIHKSLHGKAECLSITLKPKQALTLLSVTLECTHHFDSEDRMFINGWQNWTESREYSVDERMPGLSKALKPLHSRYRLQYFGDYFYSYSNQKGGYHGYTYTTIRHSPETLLLAGSLDESRAFTIFRYDTLRHKLYIEKDCNDLLISAPFEAYNIFIQEGPEEEVFDSYFSAMSVKPRTCKPVAGWNSWYEYYEHVTEADILMNLSALQERRLPLDYFQIDDGYQRAVGDWLIPSNKFPSGPAKLAGLIKESGCKPGIWIAPFICGHRSNLLKDHPDWVIKDRTGKPFPLGYNDVWGGYFYALNIYHPEVKKYLRDVFKTVFDEWGYEMVKLDFLFAACFSASSNKTRGMAMADAMDFLREICGNHPILACGVPLGSAFGKADYCRTGCDVKLDWEYSAAALINYRERVSTCMSIHDTINRRQLNGRAFLSDPDVSFLRDTHTSLTHEQKETLLLINTVFGGIAFLSDPFQNYKNRHIELYKSRLPLALKSVRTFETFRDYYPKQQRHLLSKLLLGIKPFAAVYRCCFTSGLQNYELIANIGPACIMFPLAEGFYYAQKAGFISGPVHISLQPYESICLWVYSKDKDYAIVTNNKLLPGIDVEAISDEGPSFTVGFTECTGTTCHTGNLVSRRDVKQLSINGHNVIAAHIAQGYWGYEFSVEAQGAG